MYFTTCLRIIYRLSKNTTVCLKNLAFYYRFRHLKTNKKKGRLKKIFQTAFFIKCALFNKLRPTSRVCLLSNRIECP